MHAHIYTMHKGGWDEILVYSVITWWYRCEDRELKDIGSKGCVLLRNWYLGFGWVVVLSSSSEDMVLSHAPKFCDSTQH